MVVLMVWPHVWAVLQLLVLGTLARTVGLRTTLLALAAGLYVAAPLSALLQLGWTQAYAAITGTLAANVVRTASYTVDPAIEEVVKIGLVAVLLWLLPAVRRQWGATDLVVVAGAVGSGFGLAENLLRFGEVGQVTRVPEGWMVGLNLAAPTVPDPWTALTRWLPDGIATGSIFGAGDPTDVINVHLVWSAVAGLGLALLLRGPGRWVRPLGLVLIAWAAADHAANNAELLGDPGLAPLLTPPLDALRLALGWLPLLAVVAAWWLDRPGPDAAPVAPVLAAERRSGSVGGLLAAARSCLPWSLVWTDAFVRARRGHRRELAVLPGAPSGPLLEEVRDHIDAVVAHPPVRPRLLPEGWRAQLGAALRRPLVLVWLLTLVPPLVYFVLGSWPWTLWLQRALATPVGFVVTLAAAVVALGWTGWQAVAGLRAWPRLRAQALAEATSAAALRLSVALGSCAVGVLLLGVALTGSGPRDGIVPGLHVLEALGTALLIVAIAAVIAATIFFPPVGLAALATGGFVLVPTAAAATWAVIVAGATVVGLSGVMLAQASGGGGGGGNRPTHSPHAQQRGAEGRRTGPAFNDAQNARQADVFRQGDGRWVVRGPRGREHIFEPDGTHVTSIDRARAAHQRQVTNGRRSPVTSEEFEVFKALFR